MANPEGEITLTFIRNFPFLIFRYGFVVFDNANHAQVVLSQTLHWIEGKSINVGPVHEKRMITEEATPQQPPLPAEPEKKPQSRSRS